MTNKEIEKIFSMLNKNDLTSLRNFLLKEQDKNNNKVRQKTFEEYLRTNICGLNTTTTPKLYVDDNVQKFTNGVSLYIINKNFFNVKTPTLIKGNAKGTRSNHRFEYVSNKCFYNYVSKILLQFSNIFSDCIDIYEIAGNERYTYVDYLSAIDNHIYTEKFNSKEIDTANIILDNPKYTISHNCPLLKAESEIGKCYILGFKK